MAFDLTGKRVLITGASMGVGRAVALELARLGAHVVVNASGGGKGYSDELTSLVAEITAQQGVAFSHCGSVADFAYCQTLADFTVEQLGGIDALINIAGIAEPPNTNILNIEEPDWQRVLAVHLGGTFNLCRLLTPFMVEQGQGAIINTGSHAFLGMYGGTAYAAGKGGIISLTAAMCADLKDTGVRCNVVNPGAKTRLSSGSDFEQSMKQLNERGILDEGRYRSALDPAPPEHIASVYAYLLAEQCDINGQIISASGRHLGHFPLPTEQVLAYRESYSAGAWQASDIAAAFENLKA